MKVKFSGCSPLYLAVWPGRLLYLPSQILLSIKQMVLSVTVEAIAVLPCCLVLTQERMVQVSAILASKHGHLSLHREKKGTKVL